MDKESAIDAVRDYLDGEGFRYEYVAEKQYIKLGFNIKSKLKSARVFWEFRKFGYVVYTVAPVCGDKDNLGELLKYVAMANFGLMNGNFEVDCSDGEIRYKSYVEFDNLGSLPKEIIDSSLDVGLAMMGRYGDGLAALAMGFSDAETEIKKAEPDNG